MPSACSFSLCTMPSPSMPPLVVDSVPLMMVGEPDGAHGLQEQASRLPRQVEVHVVGTASSLPSFL
jgi:hypothetical protein